MVYSATYSPDDNKLRLYASSRLDPETYARVKAAGFKWAPKQDLFVAPMWTPGREDLALELAGEIGDEDTSLTERAEERAERFEEYEGNRRADADAAHAAVSRIADGIPFGQPILVGHHSERHARRDAERIESGMRRAVKMWDTAQYWEDRAAGAIRHAKYKERPDVRARRIKKIEADKRKQERNKADTLRTVRIWENLHLPDGERTPDAMAHAKKTDGTPTTFAERARFIAGNTNTTSYETYTALNAGTITPEEAQARVLAGAQRYLPHCERWIRHYENRLAYERAMLAEAGGTVADQCKTGFYLTGEPARPARPAVEVDTQAPQFEALRDSLKAGVKVVSSPDLFPTPPDLARRMAELAGVRPGGFSILEPSAGTGRIH